jgi:diguanylate cyclase (GGDEF)-like protein
MLGSHTSIRTRLVGIVLGIGVIVALVLAVPFVVTSTLLMQLRTVLDPSAAGGIDRILAVEGVVFGVGTALAACTGVAAALLLRGWFMAPLKELTEIATRVAAGEDVAFEAPNSPEAAALAAALEEMRGRLRAIQAGTARQAAEAGVVNRFTDTISYAEDDDQVGRALVGALRELVAPDSAIVRLEAPGGERTAAVAGPAEDGSPGTSAPALRRCIGVRRGAAHLVDPRDPLAIRCPVAAGSSGTTACVPLAALGNVVGTVHLRWAAANPPTGWDSARIESLASHAALAIANRRLLLEMHGMAVTDPRTGLANSRAFDDELGRTLAAANGGQANAVVIFDLDDFKGFNDRHGHAVGDEALRAFAGVVRASLREGDLAARYGGEEFVALLRGLDVSAAASVAERIRERTQSLAIAAGAGAGERATIRVSAGVAAAPAHGSTPEALLLAADSALYAAKATGRNRVVTAWDGESAEVGSLGPGMAAEPAAVIDLGLRVSGRSGTSRRS